MSDWAGFCATIIKRRRDGASAVSVFWPYGVQIATLATLRGKLYELEEASRLGFFHEVVESDKLLPTAISYARCIEPDCNTAYAMSKKALQDGVIRQIEERTIALDELLLAGMSDEGNRRAQDRRRQEIMHKR